MQEEYPIEPEAIGEDFIKEDQSTQTDLIENEQLSIKEKVRFNIFHNP